MISVFMKKYKKNMIKLFEKFDVKHYVYKYEDNDKTYYYDVDDVEGDRLFLDVENAKVFSEKETKYLGDKIFDIDDEIWCDDINDYVKIKSELIKSEI